MKQGPSSLKTVDRRILALLAALASGASAASPETNPAAPPPVAPIRPSEELGWSNAYCLSNATAKAVLVPAVGRLVYFSVHGEGNVLRLDPDLAGRIPPENDPFFNLGGHWLWPVTQSRWEALSEECRDWPPPDPLADRPWDCSAWTDADEAACALLSREYGAPLHIQVTRLFRLEPGSATLKIQQRIERTAPSDIPVVLWSISQIAEAGRIAIPVEAESRFPKGLKALKGRKPGRRLVACGDITVYRAGAGGETKMGSDSPRDWIAAALEGQMLCESVIPETRGDYPDGGCRIALYANPAYGYAELETFSPEVALTPGQVLKNTLRMEIVPEKPPAAPCEWADILRDTGRE
jgi:hypothetical protein